MNFVIGKLGRSISSNENNWSAVGGDNEPFIIYDSLARLFPEHIFYMIGKSDFSRNKKYDKPENIIDVWASYDKSQDEERYVYNFLKDIHIDSGIIMAGPVSANINCSNLGIRKVRTPSEYAKPLGMFIHYVSPIFNYLNDSNIPWICLGPDPRYLSFGKDLFNPPEKVISQYNGESVHTHMKSLEEQRSFIKNKIPVEYKGLEKTFLVNKKKPRLKASKNIKFMIVLNEGGNGGLLRGPILKKYVLDHISDVSIYGKWSEEWLSDPRFEGPRKFKDLVPMLKDTKYTFIIPIQKEWSTAKFWEMIYYGIVPFMHPYYDSQKNIPAPDFIRISNPKELNEKIQYLEDNPEEYKALIKELTSMIKEEDLSGEILFNDILEEAFKLTDSDFEYKSFDNNLINKTEKAVSYKLF